MPNAKGMLILAIIGIAVNGVALLRLRKGSTINERVVSLHFLEDVLGWATVLLGSIIMMFFNVPILDPVLSIGISLYILFNVYKNLRSVSHIVLQGMPKNIDEGDIRKKVTSVREVSGVHDIHAWSLDGEYNILTMHVVLRDDVASDEAERIKKEIRHCLEHLKLNHITIETENERSNCGLENC
jgi:cobalt-zinc-cadmium efflux system protein